MEYQFAFPSPKLRPYVKQYWALDTQTVPKQLYQHRIIPTGLPELIFYKDYTPRSPQRSLDSSLLINGQHSNYYDLEISGRLSVFSVLFQPHSLSTIMPGNKLEYRNLSIPLKYIDKNMGAELQERLFEASSFSRQVQIIERWMYKSLEKTEHDFAFKRIQYTVAEIKNTRGKIPIEKLASLACLSRKQFERTFTEHMGISPKKFLQTVRFQSAIDIFARYNEYDLTELALECGYYDQAHCINAFKKFSGMTPRQFFKDGDVQSDFFEKEY